MEENILKAATEDFKKARLCESPVKNAAPQIEIVVDDDLSDRNSQDKSQKNSDGALSCSSYASAANYQKQMERAGVSAINDYIDKHPLTRVCKDQTWNNIAIPVR